MRWVTRQGDVRDLMPREGTRATQSDIQDSLLLIYYFEPRCQTVGVLQMLYTDGKSLGSEDLEQGWLLQQRWLWPSGSE